MDFRHASSSFVVGETSTLFALNLWVWTSPILSCLSPERQNPPICKNSHIRISSAPSLLPSYPTASPVCLALEFFSLFLTCKSCVDNRAPGMPAPPTPWASPVVLMKFLYIAPSSSWAPLYPSLSKFPGSMCGSSLCDHLTELEWHQMPKWKPPLWLETWGSCWGGHGGLFTPQLEPKQRYVLLSWVLVKEPGFSGLRTVWDKACFFQEGNASAVCTTGEKMNIKGNKFAWADESMSPGRQRPSGLALRERSWIV